MKYISPKSDEIYLVLKTDGPICCLDHAKKMIREELERPDFVSENEMVEFMAQAPVAQVRETLKNLKEEMH